MLKLKRKKNAKTKMMLTYENDAGRQCTMFGSEVTLRSMIKFMAKNNLVRRADDDVYYLTNGAGYWEKVF